MYRILSILVLLNFSCIKSTLTKEELTREFREKKQEPESVTKKIGKRNIHYAGLFNNNDVLIIFVHGSPGSWTAFLEYFKNDSLIQRSDLISVDRPGFGRSDRGWPEPSMKKQAALINKALSEYNHPVKILVGHSLGGPVIARMAMDNPDKYQGLLFIAPSIDPNQEKKEWYRSLIKTKLGGLVTPGDFWTSNEEIVPLKDELIKMLPLWDSIKSKSLILQGSKDMLVPPENAEFAKEMLTDSIVKIRYLKNVNHFIPWTHPEEVMKSLFELIDYSSV